MGHSLLYRVCSSCQRSSLLLLAVGTIGRQGLKEHIRGSTTIANQLLKSKAVVVPPERETRLKMDMTPFIFEFKPIGVSADNFSSQRSRYVYVYIREQSSG